MFLFYSLNPVHIKLHTLTWNLYSAKYSEMKKEKYGKGFVLQTITIGLKGVRLFGITSV